MFCDLEGNFSYLHIHIHTRRETERQRDTETWRHTYTQKEEERDREREEQKAVKQWLHTVQRRWCLDIKCILMPAGHSTNRESRKTHSHIMTLIQNHFFLYFSIHGAQIGSKSQHFSYFVESVTNALTLCTYYHHSKH